jgi:uncharacterized protein (DUF2225 family)
MKNTKRALRRHHRQRMIRRAYRKYVLSTFSPEEMEQAVCRWADNMAKCACTICNRRRKSQGPNFQEIRESERADAHAFYPVIVDKRRTVCYVSPTLFDSDENTEEQAR